MYRAGIFCDADVICYPEPDDNDPDPEPCVNWAFRDLENYEKFIKWNAIRIGAVVDQMDCHLKREQP